MLLKAYDIAVKCEHIVDTLVLEVLDIDGFVHLQLDQISDFMVLRQDVLLSILEAHIESVETHGLVLHLQALTGEGVHRDHINLAQGVSGFQTHKVVEGLRKKDLHAVVLCELLESCGYLQVR